MEHGAAATEVSEFAALTEQPDSRAAVVVPLVEPAFEQRRASTPRSRPQGERKSTSHLAQELSLQGHPISARAVAQLAECSWLHSLQGTRKTLEGTPHPDRNAQFEHINAKVKRFQQRGQPVISVDTKKKELKNNGREWQRKGEPERVDVHDFPDPELGQVIPYGVFDMSRNEGWVSVGIDHDTAQFAAQVVGWRWHKMGRKHVATR